MHAVHNVNYCECCGKSTVPSVCLCVSLYILWFSRLWQFLFLHLPPLFTFLIDNFTFRCRHRLEEDVDDDNASSSRYQCICICVCVCVWVSASTFMYIYNRYHTDMHMSSRQRQQLRLLQRCTVGLCTQNSWQKMQRYAELCWQLLGYNNVYMYS